MGVTAVSDPALGKRRIQVAQDLNALVRREGYPGAARRRREPRSWRTPYRQRGSRTAARRRVWRRQPRWAGRARRGRMWDGSMANGSAVTACTIGAHPASDAWRRQPAWQSLCPAARWATTRPVRPWLLVRRQGTRRVPCARERTLPFVRTKRWNTGRMSWSQQRCSQALLPVLIT